MATKKNTAKETIKRKGSVATECRDIKIFNLCQSGYSRSELAKIYSLSPNSISRILKNIEENLKSGFYSDKHPEYLPLVFISRHSKSYRGLIWDNIPYQLYILLDYQMIDAKDKEKDRLIKEGIAKIAKERVVKPNLIKILQYPWGKGKKNGK